MKIYDSKMTKEFGHLSFRKPPSAAASSTTELKNVNLWNSIIFVHDIHFIHRPWVVFSEINE